MLNALNIVGSALTAEQFRMNMALQNLTNISNTRGANNEPYRRKQVVFEERPMNFKEMLADESVRQDGGGVRVAQVVESDREFTPVYDPSHPDADETTGYVMYPNVNRTEEQLDVMAASRAYEANLTALSVVKNTMLKALEIGK